MTFDNFRINNDQFGLIANVNMSASTRFHNKIFDCWPCNDLIVEVNFGFEISVLICDTSQLVALKFVKLLYFQLLRTADFLSVLTVRI